MITRLDAYFPPKKNLSYERYVVKQAKQLGAEDSTTYIARLRTLPDLYKSLFDSMIALQK